MATRSEIIRGIARIGTVINGINPAAVFGPGTSEPDVNGVKGLPDDLSPHIRSGPAFVVLDGSTKVIPGYWERETMELEGSVWSGVTPRAERHAALVDLADEVLAGFRAHDKGFLVDGVVQAAVVTGFEPIELRRWQFGDDPSIPVYLVLPFSIQVTVNRSVTYTPA